MVCLYLPTTLRGAVTAPSSTGLGRPSGGINTWSHIWFCSDRLDEGSEITFKHCHFFLSMWQQQEGGEWMLLREGNVISLFKIWLFLGNKHNRFAGKVLFKSSGCIQSNSSSSPPLLSDSLLEVMATVKTQLPRVTPWISGFEHCWKHLGRCRHATHNRAFSKGVVVLRHYDAEFLHVIILKSVCTLLLLLLGSFRK